MMVPLSTSQCARGQCGRKVLVDINKVQDDVVGDGTTTAVLWRIVEAERLNQRIHPQTICAGWRLAQQVAKLWKILPARLLRKRAFVRNSLRLLTLSSKLVTYDKKHFAALAVEAVLRLREATIWITFKF
jgi:T-complex protein 1 subunit beta